MLAHEKKQLSPSCHCDRPRRRRRRRRLHEVTMSRCRLAPLVPCPRANIIRGVSQPTDALCPLGQLPVAAFLSLL